jgi:hypothetical protein
MSFPMFDTFLAVVRRRLRGQRVAAADRQHIHHRLLDRGLNPWMVLAIIGGLCLATGVGASVATMLRLDILAWATAATLIVLVVRLRLFGHNEVAMVAGAVADGARAMARKVAQRKGGEIVLGSVRFVRGPAETWQTLIDEAKPWNVRQLHLVLSREADDCWRHLWVDSRGEGDECSWSLAVRVRQAGYECELRASGIDVAESSAPSPSELAGVLNDFAAYFAEHAEEAAVVMEPMELVGAGVAPSGRRERRRAA